jgi:hypothetical protein
VLAPFMVGGSLQHELARAVALVEDSRSRLWRSRVLGEAT